MTRTRTSTRQGLLILAALALTGATLVADSNVANPKKWAWGENIGWTNWADANGRVNGVEVYHTGAVQYLEGWIWAENVGWISVGNTTNPVRPYLNATGQDYGVNLNTTTGDLTGFGWSENAGWINFGPFPPATTVTSAWWDHTNFRSRGWAWAENFGWINVDDAIRFICSIPGDVDNNGVVNVFDFGILAANFGASGLAEPFTGGDTDGDGDVDVFDFGNLAANFGKNC